MTRGLTTDAASPHDKQRIPRQGSHREVNSSCRASVSVRVLVEPGGTGKLLPGCDPALVDSVVRASELLPAEIANRYES
jgi:hypothetical protein